MFNLIVLYKDIFKILVYAQQISLESAFSEPKISTRPTSQKNKCYYIYFLLNHDNSYPSHKYY